MSNFTSSFNEIKINGDNNKIYIGSEDKFEPMMEWVVKKVKLNVANTGSQYLPNKIEYKKINIELKISNIFNFFNEEYTSFHIKEFIDKNPILKKYYFKRYIKKDDFFEKIKTLITIIEQDISRLEEEDKNKTPDLSWWRKSCSWSVPEEVHEHTDRLIIISDIEDSLDLLKEKLDELEICLHKKRIMILSGEALTGKTHLFCDIALNRLKNTQPTLLFFGNNFDRTKTIIFNMVAQLGLAPINENEFLQALDKWGEEYNTRTLIMIDAINETENPKIWQDGIIKFCEQIKSYPNLALAMSVRDVEKNKIITPENEEYISNEIVEVEHKGFEGIELEAVRTFCEALEVEFPKVPLHTYRLFVNPGMLFLYIESIKSSTNKVDTSIINPLTIFKSYVDDLERKYYQKYMHEVDEDDELVSEAIKEFIALGTQKDYVHFYLDYKEVKAKLKPLHKKILEFLISEGVLNKLKQEYGTKVYFTYQKFENFFIADYLLGDFEQNREKIFTLIREHHGAVSEALFMQIPETLGKEVFDLNVWFVRDRYICEQYLQSLVWRRPSTIDDNTFKYINFILGYEDLSSVFLDTVLQLSSIPSHPLNIVRLHKKLLKLNMSERDYHWSIYLHHSYSDDGIVKRIINWAWDKKEEFEIEDESLYLYGLTLGWFLTSSNRELRDGTTKALVNLFTDNINVFLKVLKEFETVADLYVLERLYAVGYGIVLRSSNENSFREFGEYAYQTIFDRDEVVEHIFLRDYAKSIVETINKKIILNVDLEKIYPPYNQNIHWELPEISKSEVEEYYDDFSSLYMSSLNGDFKIYIVYPMINHFLNLKIKNRPHPKMPEVRHDEFFTSLTLEQEAKYNKIRLEENELLALINNLTHEEFEKEIEIPELDSHAIDILRKTKLNQSNFKELLSEEQLEEYNNFIMEYKPTGSREMGIQVKDVKRLVFLEAIKLGWKKEFFEDFERNANNGRGRETGTERIGKKYQWIALYKVLSKLVDNYEFREQSYGEKIVDYKGAYQLSFRRNIDPTSILKNKYQTENKAFFNLDKSFQNLDIPDKDWMSSTDRLPTIKQLVHLKKEEKEFLNLHFTFSIDGDDNGGNYRNLYYHIDAFVIKKDCIKSFTDGLDSVNYYGQDKLPRTSSLHDMYLREYPDSDAFKYLDTGYHGQVDWDDEFGHLDTKIPCKILLTSTSYMNEGRSYDKSVYETIEIALPHKWLVEEMHLNQTLVDGEWKNEDNEVVFYDPTLETGNMSTYNENGALVADKKLLMDFLDARGYSLVWIMWGEKQVRSSGEGFNEDEFLGIAEISGYGYFEGDEFVENIDIKYGND